MKTPEFKKTYQDVPKSQDNTVSSALNLAVLKGSQETHIVDQFEKLNDQLEDHKDLIKDYNQQIEDLEKKQNLAEDIFTIAKDPEKFIDIDTKSKEDIQKIINEMSSEKRKEATLMNRLKIQLAKLKHIIPNNPQDN